MKARRGAGDVLFFVFLAVYGTGVLLWLGLGAETAIVKAIPGLHDDLHRRGGNADPVVVVARDRSFHPGSLSLESGSPATVRFVNADRGLRHSVGLLGPGGTVFAGKVVAGPAAREYSFELPGDGAYLLRCSVYPMLASVRVVAAASTLQEPGADFLTRHARAVANASHASETPGHAALDYLFSVLNLGLGLFLVFKRPRHRTARFFGVAMLGTAAAYNLQGHTALLVMPSLDYPLHTSFHPVAGVAYLYALITFPDGTLLPRFRRGWTRTAWGAGSMAAVVLTLGAAGLVEPAPGAGHAAAYVRFFGFLVPVVGLAAQMYRYRRPDMPASREQSKVLLWALAPPLAGGVALSAMAGLPVAAGDELPRIVFRAFQPVFTLIPLAVVVGILRYRLWDIEVVVRRTVVFAVLATFITSVYVAVVVGAGAALRAGREADLGLSVFATAVIAIAFEPVRERAQRLANRVVYGERATPYEVMSGFSARLSEALAIDEVLPAMAQAAARGVGALRARVLLLLLPGAGERSQWWPPGSEGALHHTVQVIHHGGTVGEISVGMRQGAAVTASDKELLGAVASQAGAAMLNVRMALELQEQLRRIEAQAAELASSRQRVLLARDAERRRVQHEISRLVEPEISSVIGAVDRAAAAADPVQRSAWVAEASVRAGRALEALQSLSRGVFPPLLADKGVVPALEAQIRKSVAKVSVDADEIVRSSRFGPREEAAAYFCCLQAFRNAVARAPGSPVSMRLRAGDGWLSFQVDDRGPGFDPSSAGPGSELQAMRDRIEALGGELVLESAPGRGTTIKGRVPVSGVPSRTETEGPPSHGDERPSPRSVPASGISS